MLIQKTLSMGSSIVVQDNVPFRSPNSRRQGQPCPEPEKYKNKDSPLLSPNSYKQLIKSGKETIHSTLNFHYRMEAMSRSSASSPSSSEAMAKQEEATSRPTASDPSSRGTASPTVSTPTSSVAATTMASPTTSVVGDSSGGSNGNPSQNPPPVKFEPVPKPHWQCCRCKRVNDNRINPALCGKVNCDHVRCGKCTPLAD